MALLPLGFASSCFFVVSSCRFRFGHGLQSLTVVHDSRIDGFPLVVGPGVAGGSMQALAGTGVPFACVGGVMAIFCRLSLAFFVLFNSAVALSASALRFASRFLLFLVPFDGPIGVGLFLLSSPVGGLS